ncbi:MAG: ion transporter [Rhodocyclaceae bacterium]
MTVTAGPAATPDKRGRLRAFIEHPRVQGAIIVLILINAALLGMETWPAAMAAAGGLILAIDRLILGVFVVEIALRLYVHRQAFWRDPWSVFDFAVVAIALLPATGPLAVLRALRVLRVLRLLTMVPSMRRVVGALLAAIPGLGSIAMVLMIIYYVFAVIATKLFAAAHPEWFGNIGLSLYTLFQVMTLESWSMGIARPVMENFPYAWAFFVPFILVATFTMLNLFIAIIVNAMQTYNEQEQAETVAAVKQAKEDIEADLHAEVRALRNEIRELKTLLLAPAASTRTMPQP